MYYVCILYDNLNIRVEYCEEGGGGGRENPK